MDWLCMAGWMVLGTAVGWTAVAVLRKLGMI